jgi:hypothetical protein
MRELLIRLVDSIERMRAETAMLREEMAAQRRRNSSRERTVARHRRGVIASVRPSELDVARAKQILRRAP